MGEAMGLLPTKIWPNEPKTGALPFSISQQEAVKMSHPGCGKTDVSYSQVAMVKGKGFHGKNLGFLKHVDPHDIGSCILITSLLYPWYGWHSLFAFQSPDTYAI